MRAARSLWRMRARSMCSATGEGRGAAAANAGGNEGGGGEEEGNAKAFRQTWLERAPDTQEPPLTPSDYVDQIKNMQQEGDAEKQAGKMTFSFMLPHKTLAKQEQVEMVLLPATTGEFGIMAGHVPVIAQLKPGVVAVHKEQDKDVKKYFVSSGFAFVHENSVAEVCAVEAVPVEQLDAEKAKEALAEYTAKLSATDDEYEKANAQIGIDVYSAMNAALGN